VCRHSNLNSLQDIANGVERKAKDAGAVAVLGKPLTSHALLEIIGRFSAS
jgi:hypothetical protein